MISVRIFPEETGPLVQPVDGLGLIPAHFPPRSVRFSASVEGDPANVGVLWSIEQGGGEIDAVGLFYAPTYPGKSTVAATSVTDKTKSATATVTY